MIWGDLYVWQNLSLNGFVASSFAAHLHSGELVAVKVQRPGMSLTLTLDALLFNMIGGQLKRFAKARKDLLVAVNEMVSLDCLFYIEVGSKISFEMVLWDNFHWQTSNGNCNY